MASFLELVKKNAEDGLVNFDGLILDTEFTVTKETRAATTVPTPQNVGRTDETKLKFTTNGITTVAGGYTGQAVNGVQMKTEFMSDSVLFEMKVIGNNSFYTVLIDGKLATLDAIAVPNGEAVGWIRVEGKEGTLKKIRHFEIYSQGTAIGGFQFSATDTVINKSPTERPLIFQMGDSYTEGQGAGYKTQAYGSQIHANDFLTYSRSLGFDSIAEGIAGSGWTSLDGRVPAARVQTRLNQMNRRPDVICWALGYNDNSLASTDVGKERINKAMADCLAETRKSFPTTPIVMLSVASPLGVTAPIGIVYDLTKDFAAENGLDFIDITGEINNSNKSVYTGTDNIHPTPIGYEFRGLGIARKVASVAINGESLVPERKQKPFKVSYIRKYKFSVTPMVEEINARSAEEVISILRARDLADVDLRIEDILVL